MGLSKTAIVAIVTYLSIVVGELVPKKIGMNMADTIARIVAPTMKLLSIITYPPCGSCLYQRQVCQDF